MVMMLVMAALAEIFSAVARRGGGDTTERKTDKLSALSVLFT